MDLRESDNFQRKHPHKRPVDIVVSFSEPLEINRVLQYLGRNMRIAEEISRDAFMAQMRANAMRPHHTAGEAPIHGAKVRVDLSAASTEPPADHKYFYRVEVL